MVEPVLAAARHRADAHPGGWSLWDGRRRIPIDDGRRAFAMLFEQQHAAGQPAVAVTSVALHRTPRSVPPSPVRAAVPGAFVENDRDLYSSESNPVAKRKATAAP